MHFINFIKLSQISNLNKFSDLLATQVEYEHVLSASFISYAIHMDPYLLADVWFSMRFQIYNYKVASKTVKILAIRQLCEVTP